MAKELPYFRFTLQEWQNGDITNMSDSAQGVFINVCVFYWARNCNVTEEKLLNRFKTKSKTIQKLIKREVIKCQNGIISISFLDQQLLELNKTKEFYSECGKKGQEVKKSKAPLKPPLGHRLNYKDKDKDKDNNKDKTIFNSFRKKYPGSKRGNGTEFDNFKKHTDWKDIISTLEQALDKQIEYRKYLKDKRRFCPEWKNLKTWIYNRCWEEEIPEYDKDEKWF